MSDIFISYARKDRERIKPLAKALEAHGWSVWWDPNVRIGELFDEVIEQALKDAKCIIVVWSRNSVSSRWVRAEANEGVKKGTLVPVLIEETDVPLAFSQIQTAQLSGWDGSLTDAEFAKLISDISLLLGPQTVNPPAIAVPAPQPSKKKPEENKPNILLAVQRSLYPPSPRIIALLAAVVLLAILAGWIFSDKRNIREPEVKSLPSPSGTEVKPSPTPNNPPEESEYQGIEREAAKSIGSGPIEHFNDVKDLIASLPEQRTMMSRYPRLIFGENSGRVAEEQRNVRVRGFLYAASLVDGTDFPRLQDGRDITEYRLIIGRAPDAQEMYMLAVVSGLPPSDSQSFSKLNDARNTFKRFLGRDLPGTSYDFYDPPIPLEIQGSLFFNASHIPDDRKPGPRSLKSRIPTIWEVRPITNIGFNPR